MERLWLTLEDGTRFEGRGLLPSGAVEGEAVFYTAFCGAPQSLSDPSYAGQILVSAFPLSGNYGIDQDHLESDGPRARGYVCFRLFENPDRRQSLTEWLLEHDVALLCEIDTRSLIRHLRSRGTLKARIDHKPQRPYGKETEEGLVASVSTRTVVDRGGKEPRIALLDYGVKESIVRHLLKRGCRVVLFPWDASCEEILSFDPEGVLLSNGPGDPSVLKGPIETVRSLVGRVPLFGICLGMQILSLACGASTRKLPFGHRGANHPVWDQIRKRGFVTSQNHGYEVVDSSLSGTGLEVTFRHLADGSVEGVRHAFLPAFGVQFHPEASPGPCEAEFLFDLFLEELKAGGAAR